MDNILHYPQSCIVGNVVPKAMFYRFMDVNPRMRARFVNDVVNITWLYKLAASTLNVTDSDDLKEIEVFVAALKQPDCPTDLFKFIDSNMPHHIVFILTHGENAMLVVNYKTWADETHQKFRIVQTFASPWMEVSELQLLVQGQSLPRIYDNFVAQVSGIGEHKAGTLAQVVELKKKIATLEKELKATEAKMRKEQQFDIQMELNKQVKAKRLELIKLKKQIENLK